MTTNLESYVCKITRYMLISIYDSLYSAIRKGNVLVCRADGRVYFGYYYTIHTCEFAVKLDLEFLFIQQTKSIGKLQLISNMLSKPNSTGTGTGTGTRAHSL
ncbi:hypothetical protein PHYBLDRAFT_170944 [Phycomyces blakesleeanus NRRL 1555(-)]|uniref:Uncharacterized protein n=1 Tax=Phycomyces blakesleeanus (strain ATCC 8743b / DSM 1359 / FGSC 10004 / NBRC 33097 / NRRL 1555) TaxID=763407 RepID=A0A162TYL5_PHYB8|nr:hypothetical protein PHYBLDRAFT_170944 [Phycomyces blakesleeanus NRRL 1555(-)]OAD70863.1 hypothetical protein PHYBLDRAFT_170944 [Phycomyces blakesleeanus NRRL 1555(-)]|eukprot:XP_018288903.1 hypothetical protein PHYBLDRAFT_170944 [Phycomyces blakesleeanus NRRL 1555(-)]